MTIENAPSPKLVARFLTLGAIDLTVPAGSDPRLILGRPKRLGLLAYLLLPRPGAFHRRDALVALFWPDLDQHHARASLRQALHWLRKVLGRDAVLARGDEEVGIDASLVSCDCVEIQDRLAAGDLEGALALYRGPLLPGLHLGGSVELEQWLDEERNRLARHALAAVTTLTRHREAAGDLGAAIGWARRAVELAPHNEAAASALVRLLDSAGDPAAAITAYESFALRLQRELEIDVSPQTRAVVHAIRRRRAPLAVHDAGVALSARRDAPA